MSTDGRHARIGDSRSRGGGRGSGSDSLLRIAEAIASREAVDWERELRENPEQAREVRGLKAVQTIASSSVGALDGSVTPLHPSQATVAEPRSRPRTWRHLEVFESIGGGAFAEVFRAHDSTLQRDVALKLPKTLDDTDRFLREVRRLARVRHQNVVAVHGAEEHDGRVGMWMDLLEGSTLEECLAHQGPFSASEAAVIGIDLCRALAAVHLQGMVHRDLKAANVMRETGGRIVLMDFSSVVQGAESGRTEDDSSTYGTPLYMAPEVLAGRDATSAADIYSLGVLLYRLVSGRYPVEAESLAELIGKLRRSKLARLGDARPDLPASFVDIVERALEIDPSTRFQTAGEMEHALSSFAPSVPRPPEPAPPKPIWKRAWARAAAGMAVLLGLAWGVLGLLPAPLSIEASLFRIGEQADELLEDGAPVTVGDLLFLEVEASRPVYTYVLNEDSLGERHVLFPLPRLELTNPLAGGVKHTLPGQLRVTEAASQRAEWAWKVDSAGGEEHFLLLASAHPLEGLEERVATMGLVFRGVGGLEPMPNRSVGSLDALLQELRSQHGSDLQVWKIRLGNPQSVGG